MRLGEIKIDKSGVIEGNSILLYKDKDIIYKAVVFVCDNKEVKQALLEAIEAHENEGDFLIVNTPEKDIHPKEQLKLYEKLIDENEKDQLFIFTGSENVVGTVLVDEDALVLKVGHSGVERISRADFALPEITYGEIQYLLFNIYSKDYHNQLYGRIAKLLEKHVLEWERAHHGDIEDLIARYEKTPGEYNNEYGYKRNNRVEKLPTYVRNAIYYPENKDRNYTEEDLEKSVEILRMILMSSKKVWYDSYIGKID